MGERRLGAAGPWVLVTGMHRSGTSAVAGALGALGLQTPGPDDRLDWPESNPEHWESLSLAVHNDELLDRLGGSWEAPPTLPVDWEQHPGMASAQDPVAGLDSAFPHTGPVVWKDPRLCVLLPYWRRFLPAPVAVIHVWRSPLAVASSLAKRDGMDLAHGVALWERYNRAALDNLAGVDCYVAGYEGVLSDPGGFVEGVVAWLASLGQFDEWKDGWDIGGAVKSFNGGMDHHPGNDQPVLLPEQIGLVEKLTASAGGHPAHSFGDLGNESLWTTALIRTRREYRTRELDAVRKAHRLEVARIQGMADYWERTTGAMENSTSWRLTRPLRSVVARLQGKAPTPSGDRADGTE